MIPARFAHLLRGVPAGKLAEVQSKARKACARTFSGAAKEKEERACAIGVAFLGAGLSEAGEIDVAKSKGKKLGRGKTPVVQLSGKLGKGLGFFRECSKGKPGDAGPRSRCPEGFESVVLKKDKEGIPTVCICRLDPDSRKKFRDQFRSDEKGRKPFQKGTKPLHLRRCIAVNERGECTDRGKPGVIVRSVR